MIRFSIGRFRGMIHSGRNRRLNVNQRAVNWNGLHLMDFAWLRVLPIPNRSARLMKSWTFWNKKERNERPIRCVIVSSLTRGIESRGGTGPSLAVPSSAFLLDYFAAFPVDRFSRFSSSYSSSSFSFPSSGGFTSSPSSFSSSSSSFSSSSSAF